MHPDIEHLIEELRRIVLEPHCQGPHTQPNVSWYHYTDAAGLKGILESGSLWATNIAYLNDPLEVDYSRSFCKEFLRNRMQSEHIESFKTLLEGVRRTIAGFPDLLFPDELQFAISFSLDGDLLSQWRAYADHGRGYSVGFLNQELLNSCCRNADMTDEASEPRFLPFRVIYDHEEQHDLLSRAIDFLYHKWPVLEGAFFEDETTSNTLKVIGAQWLAQAALCFKHEAFREEQEVRIAVCNTMEMKAAGTSPRIMLRTRDHRLVPFIPISFSSRNQRLPLTQIITGPGLEHEPANRALMMYFRSLSYTQDEMPRISPARVRLQH